MGTRLQADVTDAVVQVTFWTSLLFTCLLGWVWPWWRHWFGRAVLSLEALLVIAFAPAIVHLLEPAVALRSWFTWTSIAAFGLIPVRTVALFAVIWRIQREERTTA